MNRRLGVTEFFAYLHDYQATAELAESLAAIWVMRVGRVQTVTVPVERERAAG
jgi:hypothetical protein